MNHGSTDAYHEAPPLRYHDFFRKNGSLKNVGDIAASKRGIVGSRLNQIKAICKPQDAA
jgi:hypothetical protein